MDYVEVLNNLKFLVGISIDYSICINNGVKWIEWMIFGVIVIK